jgi:translocation and assembly module TamB
VSEIHEAPSAIRRRPKRHLRRLFRIGLGAAIVLVVAILGAIFWAGSSSCENLVRTRLIAELESATGGRVEIASFHWHLTDLDAEASGIVIHGREAASETPYARVAHIHVRISILSLFNPVVRLRELEITQPEMHLIVYSNGTTNQPLPRKPRQTIGKYGLDTLFRLQARRMTVQGGGLDYENRSANFDFQNRYARLDFSANDVSLIVAYVAGQGTSPETYRIEAGARDLRVVRGENDRPLSAPAEGFFQATLDLTRNAAYLRSLRLTSRSLDHGEQTLAVSGSLVDFNRPNWRATAKGVLDMRLLETTTGYPNSPDGLARLDLDGEGRDGQFRVDGTVHVDGGSYISDGVNARGVTLDAHVHADPEQLRIMSVNARLHQGGQLFGTVALDHWLPVIPGSAVLEASGPAPAPKAHSSHKVPFAPVPSPSLHPPPADIPVNGKITAQFANVTVDTVLDIVGRGPFQRLGVDARLNGPATANWVHGDVRTLSVDAKLDLSASPSRVDGEVPGTGRIEGTYTQRDGAVDLRTLDIALPSSHLSAFGHLGAYPVSSPSAISIDFSSRNLAEFDALLRDLKLRRAGREGTAALPVALSGKAEFHGTWTGSLIDPHLAGNLEATDVAVELPSPPDDTSGKVRRVHWDSVRAAGSYSAEQISIDHSQLTHGHATLGLEGTLTSSMPAPGRPAGPNFDADSQLHFHLDANDVGIEELLPFLGKSLPVTGQLSAQIDAAGPVRQLDASGWAEMDRGVVYGEPVARVRVQGKVAGRNLQLNSISINDWNGTISGAGGINLVSRTFELKADGANIAIARLKAIQTAGIDVTGNLGFSFTGSGTLDDPHLEAQGRLAGFSLGRQPVGDLAFEAHGANHHLIYNLTTQFASASLTAHGETALNREYTTQAKLDFSQFNIAALLTMAHVRGLTGESALAGTMTIEGPLAHPDQLHGEARLRDLAVTLSGVHLINQGPVHATLADEQLTLDPLHVTGEQTDLRVNGGIDLKNSKRLDLAASGSINLKLAETLDPDLTANGTSTFQVEAHGPLSNPGLRGRIEFQNASLALEDLPNSLSQLQGTLEFNQNRLEVRSLTATTGGGQLSVSGFLAYQHGIFANLAVTGKGVRIRYPQGISSLADADLKLQGTQSSLLLSGNILVTRFTVSPALDIASLAAQTGKIQSAVAPDAPSNHVRLDVHIQSSPQLNFQNAYAKLAGDVDLRLRGTLATPSLLGQISITEGSATIAGTRYELQRGDIIFANPVRIEPAIDLNATARVEDYDITLGLHGTLDKMAVSYRSDPPLPEADVVALLALGRTQSEQQIYGQQQVQTLANPTTEALLGGALNATVSSRVQKLFGAGAVKVDPNYLGVLGNSTTRITVEEQFSKYVTLTYATDVNTTAQQLLQAEIAINRHVSLVVARDESGVFSMVLKAVRRYR